MIRALSMLAALLALSSQHTLAQEDNPDNPDLECRPMGNIYSGGKDLCERVFGEAFKYVPRSDPVGYSLAYTMWFFDTLNPNDKVTQARIAAGLHAPDYQDTNTCYLKSDGTTFHNTHPIAENDTFTECHPFREHACCKESTVENKDVINDAYGAEYKWDRCGKLSQECERFFVQEACFYECDPNPGLFRKYTPAEVAADPSLKGEEWVVSGMPIQGDYCDAWFDACRLDYFCGDGDFFSCARIPPPEPVRTVLSPGAVAGVVVGSVALASALIFLCVLIRNERRGTPVFYKINEEDSRPLEKPIHGLSGAGQNAPGSHDNITTI